MFSPQLQSFQLRERSDQDASAKYTDDRKLTGCVCEHVITLSLALSRATLSLARGERARDRTSSRWEGAFCYYAIVIRCGMVERLIRPIEMPRQKAGVVVGVDTEQNVNLDLDYNIQDERLNAIMKQMGFTSLRKIQAVAIQKGLLFRQSLLVFSLVFLNEKEVIPIFLRNAMIGHRQVIGMSEPGRPVPS